MIDTVNIFHLSDNIAFIKTLPDNSIDAIITDSPYGLGKKQNLSKLLPAWLSDGYYEVSGTGFMGKKWDAFVPQPVLWKECLRVLKPGGYLLSFFGTRTYHLGSLAIELSGFEIRDCIQWIYGSGFPKSKASLKPANEPICVARKPGPLQMLNIDECRIETNEIIAERKSGFNNSNVYGDGKEGFIYKPNRLGRWPSNVIFDQQTSEILDTQSRFFYVAKTSPSERKGMKHPTIKPVKLMEQLVKLYCPEGGIVLDPHFGSGPTGEACENTGRNWIGIDNDPEAIADATIRMDRRNIDPEIKLNEQFALEL